MQVDEARHLLRRSREHASSVVVGLSGGKDSLTVLDLAVEIFGAGNVAAFAMYLVRGLRCFEAPIDLASRRYGIRVEYVPHFELGRIYKYAVCRPHTVGAADIRETKMVDIEALVRKRTGIDWLVYGHRAAESPQRRGMLNSCQGLNEKGKRVYPIWRWRQADVLSYLRLKRIAVPSMFVDARIRGVGLDPETLIYIRDHFPDDYARMLTVFPFASAQVARFESYQQEK
jgi:phosphoadenosine phosphosulfate reductase